MNINVVLFGDSIISKYIHESCFHALTIFPRVWCWTGKKKFREIFIIKFEREFRKKGRGKKIVDKDNSRKENSFFLFHLLDFVKVPREGNLWNNKVLKLLLSGRHFNLSTNFSLFPTLAAYNENYTKLKRNCKEPQHNSFIIQFITLP